MANLNRLICLILAAVLFMGTVACDKEPQPESPSGVGEVSISEQTLSTINGTNIASGNDVAGVVKNLSTGAGIAGVAVTDGYTVVVTDNNGVFQMKRNAKARHIYYTTPAEYKVSMDKEYSPAFYTKTALVSGKSYRVDFGLEPLPAPETNFSLVMIGDPQCSDQVEVARYKNETVRDICSYVKADKYPNAYAITLGDITHDSNSTFGPMAQSMKSVSIDGRPLVFFQCIGNHDHDSKVAASGNKTEDDYNATKTFMDLFGPTDYSFDRGKAHIVVMDNIIVTSKDNSSKENGQTWKYTNGLTSSQIAWLKADLANVKDKANKVIFICMHQPVKGLTSGNYPTLISLCQEFSEAHLMIGHTHYPQNYIYDTKTCKSGQKIYEHIHQAACGAWWYGNICVTGAPNGYSCYNIQGSKVVDWRNKGTNRPEDYQLRVYNGNRAWASKTQTLFWYNTTQSVSGNTILGNANFQDAFVAEVWDDDDSNWKVELYKDGAKIGDFTRVANGKSCNIPVCAYFYFQLGRTTSTYCNKTASHYWYCKCPTGKPHEMTGWEVKATRTIPSSKKVASFTCNKFTTDYSEF